MLVVTVEVELLLQHPVVVVLENFSFVALRFGSPPGCWQAFGRLFSPVDGWDATMLVPWQPAVTGCYSFAMRRGPSEEPWQVLHPSPLIPVCNGTGVHA